MSDQQFSINYICGVLYNQCSNDYLEAHEMEFNCVGNNLDIMTGYEFNIRVDNKGNKKFTISDEKIISKMRSYLSHGDSLDRDFLRGYIESNTELVYNPLNLFIYTTDNYIFNVSLKESFKGICEYTYENTDKGVIYKLSEINVLEYLDYLYQDIQSNSFLYSLYRYLGYNEQNVHQPAFVNLKSFSSNPSNLYNPYNPSNENDMKLKWTKRNKDAVSPRKVRFSDVAFDLTLIKKVKDVNSLTTQYDTGIAVSPPPGFYVSLNPRSSLSKSGYILANSKGIIDPAYTGNLFVSLTKVVPDAPEIKLPFVGIQMKLEPVYYPILEECNELVETERGSGGFGSTDNKQEKKEEKEK